MKLLTDIGNSRIQIALWKSKSAHKVLQFETTNHKKINFYLSKYKNHRIESIFFSCVAGEAVSNFFNKCAERLFTCPIKRIKSAKKLFDINLLNNTIRENNTYINFKFD